VSDPHRWSNVREALDRGDRQARENRGKVVAHRDFQPAATSTTERIAATFGPACGLPMYNQFFRPRATGRIEFSARLLLKLQFEYSRNRVSFFHSASTYWQALLSALEGKAADCAASILLRISREEVWLFPDAGYGAPQ